jgi:PAS domain S-box-containing protein
LRALVDEAGFRAAHLAGAPPLSVQAPGVEAAAVEAMWRGLVVEPPDGLRVMAEHPDAACGDAAARAGVAVTHGFIAPTGGVLWLAADDPEAFTADVVAAVREVLATRPAPLPPDEVERLRLAFSAGRQGLYDVDLTSGAVAVNLPYVEMLGYDPATFRETDAAWLARLHPDDLERVQTAYRDYTSGASPDYRVEFRQHTREGEWKWLLSVGRIVSWSDDGRPTRMVGTHTDISAIKAAQAELAHLRARAETMLALPAAAEDRDDAAFLQYGLDQIERLTDSRIAFLHFVDEEAETIELIAWSTETLRSACKAAYDRHYPIASAGIWADAYRRRAPVVVNDYASATGKCGLPPGHANLIRLVSVPVIEGGRVRVLTGVGNKATPYSAADIDTVRLLSEELWRVVQRRRAEAARHLQTAALEATAVAVVITDRDGTLEWCNPAFTALTGYTRDEALGRKPGDLVRSGVQAAPFYGDLWSTVLAGRVWAGELTNRRKDGSTYPESMTVTPVCDAEGQVRHFIAVKHDLTTERAIQSRLHQAEKMESIGRLAGGVAHDFNNVLTVIGSVADASLSKLHGDDPLRPDLQEILDACERAARLTRQLLTFSRQDVRTQRPVDLRAVVGDLLRMLGRLIGDHISLVTDLGSEPRWIEGDTGQLEQVVVNLVVNARDAMPAGGTVTVALDEVGVAPGEDPVVAAGGRFVRLRVEDTGVGMDEATRRRIFEPFFTTKPKGKGTGLGLATVYGVVQQSGGHIRVDSVVGRGTRFEVMLPCAEPAAVPVEVAPPPGDSLADAKPASVLVVDDEPALRAVTARVLRAAGYTVRVAGNAAEALRVAADAEDEIELLLTDVVMPGASGPELAEQLRATIPGLCVLFTSGFSGDKITRHVPTEAFLPKPYTVDELLARVAARLGTRRA